jgi:ketosteroid isomerase-like protein
MEPADLHAQVERAFNAADVDALVSLYEPDAQMMSDDGGVVTGLEGIRAVWTGFTELGGSIALTTRYAVERGDIALLSNAWTFELDGAPVASSITAEVARRQPDGSWRYVIDNPYGAPSNELGGTTAGQAHLPNITAS